MKKMALLCAAMFALIAFIGCATIQTKLVGRDSRGHFTEEPKGVLVFPPRIYLIVDSSSTRILSLPDYDNAYEIRPMSILSKNNFKIELKEGQIRKCTSNIDTTALTEVFVEALKSSGSTTSTAAGAAETTTAATMKITEKTTDETKTGIKIETTKESTKEADVIEFPVLEATFGLEPGIYRLNDEGRFELVFPK